ncbi:hypothetical protein AB0H71_19040 [Nocardia sp. NPDC050697]|uniref:hypothetical protein n=1 Tax=Nocardia sp. NPDC050697 TaxID=3155158 RepID=UPI0033E3F2C7
MNPSYGRGECFDLHIKATSQIEFIELMRNMVSWSGRTVGQIAKFSGIPRSTAYHFVCVTNSTLPKNPRQVREFAHACKLSIEQVEQVMMLWDALSKRTDDTTPDEPETEADRDLPTARNTEVEATLPDTTRSFTQADVEAPSRLPGGLSRRTAEHAAALTSPRTSTSRFAIVAQALRTPLFFPVAGAPEIILLLTYKVLTRLQEGRHPRTEGRLHMEITNTAIGPLKILRLFSRTFTIPACTCALLNGLVTPTCVAGRPLFGNLAVVGGVSFLATLFWMRTIDFRGLSALAARNPSLLWTTALLSTSIGLEISLPLAADWEMMMLIFDAKIATVAAIWVFAILVLILDKLIVGHVDPDRDKTDLQSPG